MADDELDPRYDPQFQRGYAPGTAAPARRAASDRTEAPTPYIAPLTSRAPADAPAPAGASAARAATRTPDPRTELSSTHDHASAELRARAEAAASGRAQPDASDPVDPSDVVVVAGPRRDIRRNPFLWAVLVAGVLLVIAGLGMYTHLGQQLTDQGTGTASNYLQLQFELTTAPLALAVGVAAILAVVLVHALEWQRRS